MPPLLNELRRDSSFTTEAPAPAAWVLWILRAIAALGTALSCYLAWATLSAGQVAGCSGGVFDCDAVFSSRWSSWLRVPVSFVAVSLYSSLLVALFFVGNWMPAALRRAASVLALALATAAGGAAVWFLALMLFDVRHLCPWCLGVHVCSLTVAVVAWKYMGPTAEGLRPLGTLGFVAVGALVLGQLAVPPPPKFEVTSSGEMTDKPVLVLGEKKAKPPANGRPAGSSSEKKAVATNPAPSETKQVTPPLKATTETPATKKGPDVSDLVLDGPPDASVTALKPAAPEPVAPEPVATEPVVNEPQPPEPPQSSPRSPKERLVTALSGKVRLNVYDQPRLGDPEAPFVVVKLFDYTCHHCRRMHELFEAAEKRYGENQLCVVLLPVPMNASCNSLVKQTPQAHQQACALALYALAVYRLAPQEFPAYSHWLFEPETPRTATAARAKALELVDESALKRALEEGQLNHQLQENVAVYGLCGAGPIPKLLFRQITEKGRMDRPEELFTLLEKEFPELKPVK